MAKWQKVVVSGSSAELGGLTVTSTITGAITGDAGGNAATATALATARNIGGVSFDGTANIDLPGVNSSGNQDTSGNASSATALESARNLQVALGSTSAQSFDGSGNATSIGVSGTLAVGSGGTGLTSLGTAGSDILSLARGSAEQVLRVNSSGNGLEFAAAAAGDVTGIDQGVGIKISDGSTSTPEVAVSASGTTLDVSANGVKVADAGITATQLATSVAGDGLAGGAGTALSVSVDDATIEISGDSVQAKTAAIANGGTGLATADQIHTFVTTQTDTMAAGTSGNAATATALATARDLTVALGSTSAASFDGSGNASIGVGGTLPAANGGTGLTSIATLLNSNTTATDVGLGNVTNESKATMFTSPTFTGTATAAGLVVSGDLSVAGTSSFTNTVNLSVADKYILLNSGSSGANLDSGGIVVGGHQGGGAGALFGFSSGSADSVTTRRWAVNHAFDADTSGDFTAEAFMSAVMLSSVEGNTNPDNANSLYKKPGNIFVDEASGTPYIYV